MSALKRIIELSKTLPPWESDLVRRLITKNDFSENDITEVISLLKREYGLIGKSQDIPNPKVLEKGDISGLPQIEENILLNSMTCISGINAIPDNTLLPFTSKCLNVIYGDNATGKSGFARVLKKACRARDSGETILNNVFIKSKSSIKASFSININGKEKEILWGNDKDVDNLLSNICVFDSKCARIIINEKNNAQYLPYGTDIFEKLVLILEDIKIKLEDEKPKPSKPIIPDVDLDTQSGKFYNELNIDSNPDYLKTHIRWKKEDQNELLRLRKEISIIENNDPLRQANKLRKNQVIIPDKLSHRSGSN